MKSFYLCFSLWIPWCPRFARHWCWCWWHKVCLILLNLCLASGKMIILILNEAANTKVRSKPKLSPSSEERNQRRAPSSVESVQIHSVCCVLCSWCTIRCVHLISFSTEIAGNPLMDMNEDAQNATRKSLCFRKWAEKLANNLAVIMCTIITKWMKHVQRRSFFSVWRFSTFIMCEEWWKAWFISTEENFKWIINYARIV